MGAEKPRLVGEEPEATIPENAGDVFGKPEPNGLVFLCPFDVREGEIGFAANGDLCAVVSNGNRWINIRFTPVMAVVVGEKLLQCASKAIGVH